MTRFVSLFKNVKCPVIGMVHVKPLPGTPRYANNFETVVKEAVEELKAYKNAGVVSQNVAYFFVFSELSFCFRTVYLLRTCTMFHMFKTSIWDRRSSPV